MNESDAERSRHYAPYGKLWVLLAKLGIKSAEQYTFMDPDFDWYGTKHGK